MLINFFREHRLWKRKRMVEYKLQNKEGETCPPQIFESTCLPRFKIQYFISFRFFMIILLDFYLSIAEDQKDINAKAKSHIVIKVGVVIK